MSGQNSGIGRLRITGVDLRQMLAAGTSFLDENVDAVNDLNVFPVPDGDTGTNMLLTMQSAMKEVDRVSGDDFGAVAHAAAHGALMGARGNSGVILSQILRGIARSVDHQPSVDAPDLAAALKEGANTAYRGIGKPVEGTMLTVARDAADAALVNSGDGPARCRVADDRGPGCEGVARAHAGPSANTQGRRCRGCRRPGIFAASPRRPDVPYR